jgi:hypothetical protein
VSSTFYFAELPAWVKEFNAARPVDRFHQEGLAERAVEAESLGRRDVTDLLALGFSANDAVGHAFGPDSPEVHAIRGREGRRPRVGARQRHRPDAGLDPQISGVWLHARTRGPEASTRPR